VAETTLVDVARAAGVSQSTASRVLNGSARRVRDEYAARVRDAATRLGYAVDLRAQATARRRSTIVSIVVESLSDQRTMRIASDILMIMEESGLLASVSVCPADPERAAAMMRLLRGQRPGAIFVVSPEGAPSSRLLAHELAEYEAHGGIVVETNAHAGTPLRAVRDAARTIRDRDQRDRI